MRLVAGPFFKLAALPGPRIDLAGSPGCIRSRPRAGLRASSQRLGSLHGHGLMVPAGPGQVDTSFLKH